MKIAHFALWTQQLEAQARFWVEFFAASINEKYLSQTNPGFASYFVTIDDEVVIELMTKPGLQQASADNNTGDGYYEAVIADPDGNLIEIVA